MSTKIINNIIETYFPNATESEINDLKYSLKHLEDAAKQRGIELAVSVAASYDSMSSHTHLVSDCIAAKLNLLNRRYIRKNHQPAPRRKYKKTPKK